MLAQLGRDRGAGMEQGLAHGVLPSSRLRMILDTGAILKGGIINRGKPLVAALLQSGIPAHRPFLGDPRSDGRAPIAGPRGAAPVPGLTPAPCMGEDWSPVPGQESPRDHGKNRLIYTYVHIYR